MVDSESRSARKLRLANLIAAHYLDSVDFNGIAFRTLTSIEDASLDELRALLLELVAEGAVYANFGHEMVNFGIMGVDHQGASENLEEVRRRGGVDGAVMFPTMTTLAALSAGGRYPDAPYSAALALGRGQLESVFFDAAVLGRYRDDPRYDYTHDIGGEIRAREGTPLNTYLTTFSIGFDADPTSSEIVVGVPLRYLHDLDSAEQQYWRSFQSARQDWILHPDWVRPHLMGEFPEQMSPYTAVIEEMRVVNEICDVIRWPRLYRRLFSGADRPTDFGYPIRPTARELGNFVEQLNKMLIDNLDPKFFERARIETTEERSDGRGTLFRAQRGTLAMLKEFMEKTVTRDPSGAVPASTETLRQIRKLRSSIAHDVKANEYNADIWQQQSELVSQAYRVVLTIRQLLQSHPLARGMEIPEMLDDQRVWSF